MPTCNRCGTRLALEDETTKLVEYACPTCHDTRVTWKAGHRRTGAVVLDDAAAD